MGLFTEKQCEHCGEEVGHLDGCPNNKKYVVSQGNWLNDIEEDQELIYGMFTKQEAEEFAKKYPGSFWSIVHEVRDPKTAQPQEKV